MNDNDTNSVVQQLQMEKNALQTQIVQMRLDYGTLKKFHKEANQRIQDLKGEIADCEQEISNYEKQIATLLNQLAVLADSSTSVSFQKMLTTNLTYLKQLPISSKLLLGSTVVGTVGYKMYGKFKKPTVIENEQPTFVLTPPSPLEVEKLAPPPVDKKQYQTVVEVSTCPIMKEIIIRNQNAWSLF